MNDKSTKTEAPADEILYQGNRVPRILRYIYLVFVVWAVSYFLINAWPDLKAWLS